MNGLNPELEAAINSIPEEFDSETRALIRQSNLFNDVIAERTLVKRTMDLRNNFFTEGYLLHLSGNSELQIDDWIRIGIGDTPSSTHSERYLLFWLENASIGEFFIAEDTSRPGYSLNTPTKLGIRTPVDVTDGMPSYGVSPNLIAPGSPLVIDSQGSNFNQHELFPGRITSIMVNGIRFF